MFIFRSADTSDIDRIAQFNCCLARETEGKELDYAIVRRGVLRGMQLAAEVRYFVVEADGEAETDAAVIGQLMLTREWSDWRDGWMVWLQSVYVAPAWRGKGVFRKLFAHAIEAASIDGDVVSVRLYVERGNQAANVSYRKMGFADAGYDVLEMPLERR